MAQSVFKTVIARYKTILENQNKWMKPSFKRPQYDLVWNRDYSLTQNCFSVNTLNGRIKLPYFVKGMSKYFDHAIYKFGTAKLVNKYDKYFLHIPVTYEVKESNISDICNVVGLIEVSTLLLLLMTANISRNLLAENPSNKKELITPNFAKSFKCARHHLQDEEEKQLVHEKIVGCRM